MVGSRANPEAPSRIVLHLSNLAQLPHLSLLIPPSQGVPLLDFMLSKRNITAKEMKVCSYKCHQMQSGLSTESRRQE